jgi:hypothetical protein
MAIPKTLLPYGPSQANDCGWFRISRDEFGLGETIPRGLQSKDPSIFTFMENPCLLLSNKLTSVDTEALLQIIELLFICGLLL